MAYTRPVRDDFDAVLWAENKTIKTEQVQDGIISTFISGYEDFWGVDNGTSRHSREQMQAIIDVMPAALNILTDAFAFKTFANQAFPGKLAEKYNTGVFHVDIDGNGIITVGDLNEAWVPVVEEEEVPE